MRMKLTKKILQRDKLIAELCEKKGWNPNNLTPYQMSTIAKEIQRTVELQSLSASLNK